MDELLIIVTLLAEAITVLQCIQIVFMQRIKFDRTTVGLIFVDVVIYLLINLGAIPFIGVIAVYIYLWGFCYFKFKRTITETIVRFMVSCALIAGIEGIAILIFDFFKNADNTSNTELLLTLSSIISLLFAYLIRMICYVFVKYRKEKRKIWK